MELFKRFIKLYKLFRYYTISEKMSIKIIDKIIYYLAYKFYKEKRKEKIMDISNDRIKTVFCL